MCKTRLSVIKKNYLKRLIMAFISEEYNNNMLKSKDAKNNDCKYNSWLFSTFQSLLQPFSLADHCGVTCRTFILASPVRDRLFNRVSQTPSDVSAGPFWSWRENQRHRRSHLDLHHVAEKCASPAERYTRVLTEVPLPFISTRHCATSFRSLSSSLVVLTVFQKYKSYSPYDMQESIVKEVKGDLQKSFLVLGKYSESEIDRI